MKNRNPQTGERAAEHKAAHLSACGMDADGNPVPRYRPLMACEMEVLEAMVTASGLDAVVEAARRCAGKGGTI